MTTENSTYSAYFSGVVAANNSSEKEFYQLRHTIDRFFGTKNGHNLVYKTMKRVDEKGDVVPYVTEEIDLTSKNIFAEMARLGLMLCGGAINSIFSGSTVNDLDFYMKNEETKAEAIEFLKHYFTLDEIVTVNANTYRRKSPHSNKKWTVQLITRFIGEASDIFQWFDFTITHGAFDFEKNCFIFGDRFFPDLAKRRLVYSGSSKYPICAMYRTKKYSERGYELPGATIMHIALSIVQLKISNYKELKEQLMGIDTMYLQKLLEAKNPDAPVDYGEFIYEAFQVIDRITGLTQGEEDDEA
jgi:hypothetical protein